LARQGERVLVVQPTKELIDKTVEQELLPRAGHPPYKIFHGGTVDERRSVAHALTEYAKSGPSEGEIVFTTHQVLPYVRYWANNREWHLLIDEELQVLRYKSHRLPNTHGIITEHLVRVPHNSIYERIQPQNHRALEAMGKNPDKDEIWESLSETVRTLVNPHWDTFVNTEQYERLLKGDQRQLAFHSILKPSLLVRFGSVFMAAANFEDTAVYRVWEEMGVHFKEDQDFTKSLRFSAHANGSLVTIYYATEEQWSKRRMETTHGPEQTTALDRMIRATKDLFGDGHHLWQANKSFEGNPFGRNALRLSNKPHGLNTYDNVHDIAFLSAINPTTDHFRFLKNLGLSGGDVRRGTYHAAAYQSALRASIRKPDNRDPKRILVPDRGLAEYLHELFPGSKIEHLDIGLPEVLTKRPGRRRRHLSGRARAADFRRMGREKKLRMLNEQVILNADQRQGLGCRNETTIDIFSDSVTRPTTIATLYSGTSSARPKAYLNFRNEEEFIEFLQLWHGRHITGKEENYLISPAVFDPEKMAGTSRGIGNIVYLRHLYFDFEDGELGTEELPNLFPNLRMVVTNTFHHTKEKPRYRVIVPTTQPVTPEVHLQLNAQFAAKLEDAGYYVKKPKHGDSKLRPSGLDWPKRTPISLFYLPCQAENPNESFFRDYAGPDRTILDPLPWVEHGVIPLQPDIDAEPRRCEHVGGVDEALVRTATATWRESPSHPGEDNSRFFELALTLRRAGMPLHDIAGKLGLEAAFGRSPQERKAQISSIITTLTQRRRR
jgi:hypothetical protein